jgi:hypothetical protein
MLSHAHAASQERGLPLSLSAAAPWGIALATAVVALVAPAAHAQVTPLGPAPYLSFADSPFNGPSFSWFVLLTAEPGSDAHAGILINTIGGGPVSITGPGGITDSVDGDDGVIDGSGSGGRSYFTCPSAIEVLFDATTLGSLPTHAGIVWTDGNGVVTVQAFDGGGTLLGTVTGNSSDGNFNSGTAEDRFYGFISPGGIGRLTIGDQNNCIEVDHIQAGRAGPGGCGPADIGGAGGLPGADGHLDNNDFIVFITYFFNANALADRGIAGGLTGHDGLFNNNDFIAFINQFFAGC